MHRHNCVCSMFGVVSDVPFFGLCKRSSPTSSLSIACGESEECFVTSSILKVFVAREI